MNGARAIAERYGLGRMFEIDHAEVSALVNKGDYAAAKARLEAMERGLSPARRMQCRFSIMFARCSKASRPAGRRCRTRSGRPLSPAS
jgi:hypothetical protein